MGKIVKIDADRESTLVGEILREALAPKREQVLCVTEYLDGGFSRVSVDDIDDNGYPTKRKMVSMLSSDGMALKTLSLNELLMLLDDKFNTLIRDDNDRRKFLKRVIIDWYNNETDNGMLTVNYIK
ncbi:MAG: hypothetical protein J6Y37_13025 [Paludibacteraceae bacterium]|nr:hypothetical protein [Paludibacteraceae bacterium]